jgi:Fe-S cluster assembly ATPase SufC
MVNIFDREFRREKNLENAKRMAEKQPKADNTKAEKRREEIAQRLQKKLAEIDNAFFDEVAAGEDVEAIKARGKMKSDADQPQQQQ